MSVHQILYIYKILSLLCPKKKYQKTLIVWTLICEPHNKKQIITHKESGKKTTHKQTPPQNINNTQLTHTKYLEALYCKNECPLLPLCICHIMVPTFLTEFSIYY